MIKIFRKIRYDLMNQNKTGKYLKYAIGEIILVVIGILIALQVNNLKERKDQKLQEAVYLKFILDDLLLQKQENISQRDAITAHISMEDELIEYISKQFKVGLDQRNDIKSVLSTLPVGRTYGAYEATFLDLTSSGNIALISNQTLKNQILQHYQIQKRDREVINNNTLNTYKEMWIELVDRNLIVISSKLNEFVKDYTVLELNSSLEFLDETLFENLSKKENLILIQNVLAYKVTTTKIAVKFIDNSDTRMNRLIQNIKTELKML